MANPSAFTVQKTNEDRIDRLWNPTTPLAIDALRNIKTAPVRGSAKIGTLIRASTDLGKTRPDLSLLDLWVDDGSNGNLDKTIRSLRFSAASSNIYSLFSPERKQTPVAYTVGETNLLSKEAHQADRRDKIAEDHPMGSAERKHSNHAEKSGNGSERQKVGRDCEWLETEPVTPRKQYRTELR